VVEIEQFVIGYEWAEAGVVGQLDARAVFSKPRSSRTGRRTAASGSPT
jgi:hypothetical protein